MNKDEIMKQFDEAIKNLREWVEEKEPKPKCKHELDDNVLLTHPPKYRCKKCGELFQSILCVNQEDPKPEWERRLICQLEDEGTISDYCSDCVNHIKDFIRQEFMELALDIKRELLPERYYPDVKQHTRNQMWIDNAILGALRKRGVK